MNMKQAIIIFILVLLCASVTLSWTPPGGEDIDLRYWSEIVNGTNISTINFYQDGNAVLDNTSIISANYSDYANYSIYANSSAYLDNHPSSDFILSSSESDLNVNSSVYSTNASRATEWDGETSQADLNVNDSDYLDGYDSTNFILSADEGNLNVNSSNITSWWATLSGWSSTMFEAVANELSINLSWFNDSTDSRVATLEPDLNVNHSDTSDTATTWDGETSQADLNVNGSGYWDNRDTAADLNNAITIQGENITGGTIDFARLPSLTNQVISHWDNITNKFITAVDNIYIYMSGTNATLNETKLNKSIIALENHTSYYRPQSWDNFTGIPHATPSNGDVTHFSLADEIYDWVIGLGYVTADTNASTACTGGEVLYGNGSCGTPPDTTYSAGGGISLNASNYFSVAGNTALTQDADGLSVTADAIGDTQLEHNTGQPLTPSSIPTFAEIDAPSNWTNNQYYPSYCPDYSALTGLNDTLPCADWWLNINGGEDVTGLVNFTDKIKVGQTTTTGNTVLISRDLASASTDSPVVQITQDNSGDDQPALHIQNDGTGGGLDIDFNHPTGIGNALLIDSEGAYNAVQVDVSGGRSAAEFQNSQAGISTNYVRLAGGTSHGTTAHIYRNLNSSQTVNPVVLIQQDNAGDDQPALKIQNDGTGYSLHVYGKGAGGIGIYAEYNISGLDIIDRSAFPDEGFDALTAIKKIKSDGTGNVNHSTLPEGVYVKYDKPKYEMVEIEEEIEICNETTEICYKESKKVNQSVQNGTEPEEGRNLGAMTGVNTIGIQQLMSHIEMLETELCKPDNIFEKVLQHFNITEKYAFCSKGAVI